MGGRIIVRLLSVVCSALLFLVLGDVIPSYAQSDANVVIKFIDDSFTEHDTLPNAVAVGETFKIVVKIESGTQEINAATISLKFDDDVLAIVPYKPDPFSSEVGGQIVGGWTAVRNVWGNTAGDEADGYAETTVFAQPAKTGISYVIIYEFEAIANGKTALSHYTTEALSPVNGKTEVYAPPDATDVTGTTASTSEFQVGEPLAVTIGWFMAERVDNEVVFHWQTVAEIGTAGFYVLAIVDDGALQLNQEMIPSTVIDSITPTSYSFTTTTAATQFVLQQVGVGGDIIEHGPFDLGMEYGVYTPHDNIDLTLRIWLPLIE
ncbi:MAG: hypothetical protein H6642_17810 [Caldilineaceae bacterium]|nr:hypothetical protein [Caldilineaceae bacterium]